jgi:hypothetical protein
MTINNGSTPDSVEPSIPDKEPKTEVIGIGGSNSDEPSTDTSTAEMPIVPETPALSRLVAAGILAAWPTIREDVFNHITHVLGGNTKTDDDEPREEEIAYHDRQHALLWILELLLFVGLFLGASAGYVFFTGNYVALTAGVIGLTLLTLLGLRVSSMFLDATPHRRANKRQRRLTGLALVLYVLVLCAGFTYFMRAQGFEYVWSLSYLFISFLLLYLTMREHYKWAEMKYRRAGNVLYAERPARSRYFLATFKRRLILTNVNTVSTAQTWFEEKVLRMYRIKMTIDASMGDSAADFESETDGMSEREKKKFAKEKLKEDKFWRDMSFIRNGAVLADAIEQGSRIRRR